MGLATVLRLVGQVETIPSPRSLRSRPAGPWFWARPKLTWSADATTVTKIAVAQPRYPQLGSPAGHAPTGRTQRAARQLAARRSHPSGGCGRPCPLVAEGAVGDLRGGGRRPPSAPSTPRRPRPTSSFARALMVYAPSALPEGDLPAALSQTAGSSRSRSHSWYSVRARGAGAK